MHIKDKLAEAERTGKPMFSFEFFPPKTAQVLSSCDVPFWLAKFNSSLGCSESLRS